MNKPDDLPTICEECEDGKHGQCEDHGNDYFEYEGWQIKCQCNHREQLWGAAELE